MALPTLSRSDRLRPSMMLNGVRTLAGEAPDGTTDYGPIAANINGPFEVWNGGHGIDTNTIITAPFHARAGGQLVLGPGVELRIDAAIWGDPYAHLFDASAPGSRVTGTFGGAPVSPGWWGAKDDALPDGTSRANPGAPAFNSLTAFQQCLAARRRGRGNISKVVVPNGAWFIAGQPLLAIVNPDWYAGSAVPQYLCASALLQVMTGDCFTGGGWDSCRLVVGSVSTGNAIAVGGWDTQGPPSEVGGFMLAAQEGGAYGCWGLEVLANGAQIRDMWANGFIRGFHFASTDQHARNLVAEFCIEGFRFSRGGNSLKTAVSHLCGNGYVVEHVDQQGTTTLEDCRAVNPISSLPGHIAFAFTGANTSVHGTNLLVEGEGWLTAVGVWYCRDVTLVACTAKLTGNTDALDIGGASNVSVTDFKAEIVGGTVTTARGLRIWNGAGSVDINGGRFKGFIASEINTAGDTIGLANVSFTHAKGWNLDVIRATSFTMVGGFASYGVDGGIRAVMAHGDSWTFCGVQAHNGGIYSQQIGLLAEVNHAAGRIRVAGGSQFRGNVTAQVQNTTGMVGAPYFVVSPDCVT